MTVIVECWWYTARVVVFVSGVIGLVSFYINTVIIVIHGFGNLENVYINTCCPMFILSKCTKAARHNNTFNVIRLTCFESIALEVTVILRWCRCYEDDWAKLKVDSGGACKRNHYYPKAITVCRSCKWQTT